MALRCRVQLKILPRYMANTGVMQDAVPTQGPGRSDPSVILATLEIHLLFAAEAVQLVKEVSDANWGKVLG
jgi:hypothetical protein